MGDGERVKMSPSQVKAELKSGAENASATAGIPMLLEVPIDRVSRASKALALIGKADGL